jgi:hypothetical protein
MRGLQRAVLIAMALACAVLAGALPQASAAQRKCQTLVTCSYAKGGTYRGCLSSYSCRQCRFVSSRCSIGNTRGQCRKLVCDWGG